MRRVALALVVATALALQVPVAADTTEPVPDVADGFTLRPLASVTGPTAITVGPGDGDGRDLYATTLGGDVVRVSLRWTDAGPVSTGTTTVVSGFNQPLGLAFGSNETVLYVSDSHPGTNRTEGYVAAVTGWRSNQTRVRRIVDGLPNGRHNTNHVRFGPAGHLYIANGNANDAGGTDGGLPDVDPYSGAILAVNASQVRHDPAVLNYTDAKGDPIATDDVASHPINQDFDAKVTVVARGFRNVYGVAFGADDRPWTATNGADSPASQDGLYRLSGPERERPSPNDGATDYGFPECFNGGSAGATGENVTKRPNPRYPGADCRPDDHPPADALLGWHVCATGLDFPSQGGAAFDDEFADSVYVGECGPFFLQDSLNRTLENPDGARHNMGHKVARVALNETGHPVGVSDFVTGLALPTDVRFGPDGAMYVADAGTVYHVAPVSGTSTAAPRAPGLRP